MESLKMKVVLPVKAGNLYKAWLNSKEHSLFTGAEAKVSAKINGKFTAWDGYITGKNLELKPGKKIVQTWRTSEFAEDAPDSKIEIKFEEKAGKTTLHLSQTNLQKGDAKKHTQGWKDFYFTPMKNYFTK